MIPSFYSLEETAPLTGDLGHNASAFYVMATYVTQNGETFSLEEVMISDKTRYVYLTPKEARRLRLWLEQEEPRLVLLEEETA